MTFTDTDNDMGWQLGADDNDQSWFAIRNFADASGALTTSFQTNAKTNAALAIYSATGRVFINKGSGVSTGSGSQLMVGGSVEASSQLVSTVATGTAPLSVSSTTMINNLNADMLDGYEALNLPYLQGTVNQWILDAGGQARFYFSNNSHTYFRTGDDFFFRNDSDQTFASWDQGGRTHFHEPGSNSIQSTYRMQVTGDNGLNVNASEGLSSGQKSTVLRATGDKQWIDSYGIFKRNRQAISESVTISSSDNCMTAGPITINNGSTVTVSNGGAWAIV